MEFGFYPEGDGFPTKGLSRSMFVKVCVCGSHLGNRREGGRTGGRRPMRGLLQWSGQFIHLCPWGWRGEGWETGRWLKQHQLGTWGEEATCMAHRFLLGVCALGIKQTWAGGRCVQDAHRTPRYLSRRWLELRREVSPRTCLCRGLHWGKAAPGGWGVPRRSWGHKSFLSIPFLALDC